MPSRSYLLPQDSEHLVVIAKGLRGEFEELAPKPTDDAPTYAPLFAETDLPNLLGISPSIIAYFLKRPSKHYRIFEIEKKSGGKRVISSPRTWLKVTQWWIYENILAYYPYDNCVYGFVRGRGPLENAQHHFGAAHVLNMDVKDFFPSIGVEACRRVFGSLGYNNEVSNQLSWICTYNNQLPQGAPTSPAISNIYMASFDRQMLEIAEELGAKYTRYADDITFSSNEVIAASLVERVTNALENVELKPNLDKTRFMGRGDRMEVTGFVINEKVQLPRRWRKRARAKLHQYLSGREVDFDWHYVVGLFGAISNQQDSEGSVLYRQAKLAAQRGKPQR